MVMVCCITVVWYGMVWYGYGTFGIMVPTDYVRLVNFEPQYGVTPQYGVARGRLHHWHQIYMRLHIRHKAAMGLIGTEIKIQRKHTNTNAHMNTNITFVCTNRRGQNSPLTEKIQA